MRGHRTLIAASVAAAVGFAAPAAHAAGGVFTLAGKGSTDAFDLTRGTIGLVESEDEGRAFDYTLHRLDPNGRDTQFAGTGGDAPGDVLGLGDGSVVYTLPNNGCIRLRSATGTLSSLAGRCDVQPPALRPVYVAALGGGAYVFSEGGESGTGRDNTRLVRREADGRLTPLAPVSGVYGLAAERDGSVLVSTRNRIMRVSPTGVMTVAADTDATAGEVAALPGGGFLFVDPAADRIRQVSPSGAITTFAGGGKGGTGSARGKVALTGIGTLDVLRDGSVAFSDRRGLEIVPGPGSKRLLAGLPATAASYRAAVRERRSLPVTLTRRARVKLVVSERGRTALSVTRTLPAGTTRVRLPRRATSRRAVTLSVRAGAGRAVARYSLVLPRP